MKSVLRGRAILYISAALIASVGVISLLRRERTAEDVLNEGVLALAEARYDDAFELLDDQEVKLNRFDREEHIEFCRLLFENKPFNRSMVTVDFAPDEIGSVFDPRNVRRVSVRVNATENSPVRSVGTVIRRGRNGEWKLVIIPIMFAVRNLDKSADDRLAHLLKVMEQTERARIVFVFPSLQSIEAKRIRMRIAGEIEGHEVPVPLQ